MFWRRGESRIKDVKVVGFSPSTHCVEVCHSCGQAMNERFLAQNRIRPLHSCLAVEFLQEKRRPDHRAFFSAFVCEICLEAEPHGN